MPGNPVVGSTVLRRPAIQSPNFVQSPLAGWAINADGSAFFANLTLSGTFDGVDFILNSAGMFLYSGTPAAGNLIFSAAPSTVTFTDQFGNHCVPLTGWYDNVGGFFTQIGAGFVTYGTGSLSAGWTANTSMQNDSSGDLSVSANGTLLLNGTGGVTINGSSSTGVPSPNSTSTNGLSSPGITGTSGAQSAGTAHTHSAGSYVVGSGQHSHDIQDHTHAF